MIKKFLLPIFCISFIISSFYISTKYFIKTNHYKKITQKRLKNISEYSQKYFKPNEWQKTNCGYYLRSKINFSEKLFSKRENNTSFVFIIASYNNEKWCEKNLRSVFDQEYENYRVIYIDDKSSDNTFEIAKSYVKERNMESHIQLIKNNKRNGALANIYSAIHSCTDDEIVILLDGDDWLAHEKVLTCLNEYYSNPDIWLTYGNFIYYPSYQEGFVKTFPEKIIKKRSFRNYPWVATHLRSFYAGLFKKIKLQDFIYLNNWYEMAWDLAIMYPMLEMAGTHFATAEEILYIYNRDNVLNDDKVNAQKQIFLANNIKQKTPYSLLSFPPYYKKKTKKNLDTDIVIFSYDRPMQLYACLESIYKHITNFNNIYIIYRTSNNEFDKGYLEIQKSFPQVSFLKQGPTPYSDFKPLMMKAVFGNNINNGSYVLFAVDDNIVKDNIDLNECVIYLEQTKAYGFFFRLGLHVDYCYSLASEQGIPPLINIKKDVFAWQFNQGKHDWKYPNNVDMTLYQKETIKEDLEKLEFHNPNTFEGHWSEIANFNKIGLCFNTSKIINIPLNLVNISTNRNMNFISTDSLLEKFMEGFKIDIEPLNKIQNKSAHINYKPEFIKK